MKFRKARLVAVSLLALTVGACGGGGGSTPASTAPPPAPTASLTASATDVKVGDAVNLTWSSANASSCSASGGAWSGALSTSGTQSQSVPSSATYTVTCTGTGGSVSTSVAVTAWNAPSPAVSTDVSSVLPNNTVTVTWSSQNAKSCAGADGLSGALALSGSQASPSLATTTILSVSCSNPAFAAVKASATVTVSTTFTATVAVQYQVPGPPVVDQVTQHYIPDWTNPITKPVPFVWVEVQNSSGQVVQHAYADANGVATLGGLDPSVVYTPVVRSKIAESTIGLDFVVLNNTAPTDISQPAYRSRYPVYANPGPAFTPGTRLTTQSMGTLTAGDGWDSTQKLLIDANRAAAPYALLANAVFEAQIVSAAVGGTPTWRPLTILWSTKNKGGLSAPPRNMDQGFVTGSGGYYNGGGHSGVDPSGKETLATVAEDAEFLSGDQTFEPMDIYPFVLTHEMAHFTQALFSAIQSPGGSHSATDYEDQTLARAEGSASGVASLVLQSPKQNRVQTVGGQLIVGILDPVTYTVNGNVQSWPLGWYQENSVTRLMWQAYDPAGTIKLSAPTVLAPTFTSAWKAGPWLATPWAYTVQLAKLNPASATAINSLADSINIKSTGGDEWGSTETNSGIRSSTDALPPFTTVTIGGGPVQICSAGSPNDYNKESNVRFFRIPGDGNSHTLTVQGATGTVPVLQRVAYTAGSRTTTLSGTVPVGYTVLSVGDCAVALSQFSTSTAACNEPATPPAEQCWTVAVQ
jgi:hypothetical protein